MQLVRLCILLGVFPLAAGAASPSLDVLFPAGAARNSTNTVTLSGKFEPWPPKVWVSSAIRTSQWSRPGPLGEAGDIVVTAETNKGKLTLIVAAEAAPGPRLVRVFNDEGTSEPRIFVVGGNRELLEAETNNHFAQPQIVEALPATINGRLGKGGDVDSFAVRLRADEQLEARVDSYTLMSKLDGVLRFATTNGHQLAWNHDFISLDPRLLWRAAEDQTVVVQLFGFPHPATSDVRLYGSDSAFYRLHLRRADDGNAVRPAAKAASQLTIPASVRGCIDASGEDDRYKFTANKDDVVEMRITAAGAGSALDAWLAVLDGEGKELTRDDDANNSRDPVVEWKAPSSGTYSLVVGSLTHRGGPEYRYDLEVQRVGPDFQASLATPSLVVVAGATNTLKFKVKRGRGHTNDLAARVSGLPSGVRALATNLSSRAGDFEIVVVAATNAPAFSGPIHLFVTDEFTREERLGSLPLTSRTEDNGVPGGYTDLAVESIDHCWLTVRRKPDEAPKTAAAK